MACDAVVTGTARNRHTWKGLVAISIFLETASDVLRLQLMVLGQSRCTGKGTGRICSTELSLLAADRGTGINVPATGYWVR